MNPGNEVFCCVCGVIFDHTEILHPNELDEDVESQMSIVYDAYILPAAQSAWIHDYQVFGRGFKLAPFSDNKSTDPDIFISEKGEWLHATGNCWNIVIPSYPTSPFYPPAMAACYLSGKMLLPLHSACLDLLEEFTRCEGSGAPTQSPMTVGDFADAFEARDDYYSKLRTAIENRGQGDQLPPPPRSHGGLQWTHCYFGAQRLWADPWHPKPGAEWFCADPIYDPQAEQFLSRYLSFRNPQTDRHDEPSPTLVQFDETLSPVSPLLRCPAVIFSAIASYLPLRSVLNFHATSWIISSRLPPIDTLFWRSRTLQLHGDWLWEVQSFATTFADGDWKALLQALTTARHDILAGAKPFWGASWTPCPEYRDSAESDAAIARDRSAPLLPIPLGLKNRYRIWMCLGCVNMDGSQRRLHGLQDEEILDEVVRLATIH
ncbi:hypothetical protein MMC30_007040 [Trapelia coarctata]|nr:hypothetical protein [Trapelia coarctata]